MTTGDAAAAVGLSVVPATKDYRLGYDDINRRGDELANHMTLGGHPFTKISGQLQTAQLATAAVTTPKIATAAVTRPKLAAGVLPRWGLYVEPGPRITGAIGQGALALHHVDVPTATYPRLLSVVALLDMQAEAQNTFRFRIATGPATDGSLETDDAIASVPVYNHDPTPLRMGACLAADILVPANTAVTVRVWLEWINGGGLTVGTVYDQAGDSLRISWREVVGANQWS